MNRKDPLTAAPGRVLLSPIALHESEKLTNDPTNLTNSTQPVVDIGGYGDGDSLENPPIRVTAMR